MIKQNQPFILKIIYWTSIFLICFWVFTAILAQFVPLEFNNSKIEDAYYTMRFYGLPLAIILTLTGTMKYPDISNSNRWKILLTLLIAAVSFFFMIISLFTGMCGWATDKIFFEHKKDGSVKIIERHYDCGATDSGIPKYETVKINEVTKYLIWVTEIDTNKINKNEWTRIER